MSSENLRRRRRASTVFEETSVLADILEDVSYAYTGERESVRVNTGTRSAANMDGAFHVTTEIREEVGRPMDGPNKLRYIIDDLAHAIQHDRVTDFDAIEDFVAEYEDEGEAHVVLAALVATTLEDQYVDTSRLQRHRGHRRSVAFKHAVQMRGTLRPPLSDLEPEPALVEGYIQLATAGYVKNADALSTRRQVLLRWMRKKINEGRYTSDQQERIEIARELTDQIIDHADTNHTAAKGHVFNNPPPTHDLDPLLEKFGVDQTQDGSGMMNNLKSKFNRMKQKAKQKAGGGGSQMPEELPDDLDFDDVDMDDIDDIDEEDMPDEMPDDMPEQEDADDSEAASRSAQRQEEQEVEDEEDADETRTQRQSTDDPDEADEMESVSGEHAEEDEERAEEDPDAEPQPSAGESEEEASDDAEEQPSAGQQGDEEQDVRQEDEDGEDGAAGGSEDEEGDEDDALSDGFHDDDEDVSDLSSGGSTPDVGSSGGNKQRATSDEDGDDAATAGDDGDNDKQTAGDGTEMDDTGAPSQGGDGDEAAGGEPRASDAQEQSSSLSDALEAGDAGEWYGSNDGSDDYLTPSDRAEERFESLKRAVIKKKMGELDERRSKRDQRINASGGITHDIEAEVQRRGLVEEVVEMFYRLKTRDRDVRATKGRRLNERAVVRNLSGNFAEQKLYFKRQRAETGDRAVGVAVDLSGSMDAVETMVALGTLAEAVDIIGDELVITTFHNGNSAMITGPEEEFDWDHFEAARAGGSTPTAHGVLDAQLLLDEVTKREKVLFVLTDGQPNVGLEETRRGALEDAKAQVKRARQDDVKVIGLGLSGVDERKMEQMFGQDNYVMVDEKTLAEDLLTVYRNQMSTVGPSYN